MPRRARFFLILDFLPEVYLTLAITRHGHLRLAELVCHGEDGDPGSAPILRIARREQARGQKEFP